MKTLRRRRALRLLTSAVGFALFLPAHGSEAAEAAFTGATGTFWNVPSSWTPAGVPVTGSVVDIYRGVTVLYNTAAPGNPDVLILQIAGGTTSTPAELLMLSSATLQAGNIYLGGTLTGSGGSATGTGPGEIVQSSGFVNLDPGGVLAVDPSSIYLLSGTGTIIAYNENLAGIFTQNSGSNLLASGSILNNSGTYSVLNSGIVAADTIINTATFNQSSSAVLHGTASTAAPVNFNNSGTYLYNSGTFTGFMTNNPGALVGITTSIIPFSQGILNNGQMSVTGATGTYSGAITGSGNMVISGSGSNVTLAGTNAYFGSTSVTSGTLTLSGPVGTAGNNFGGSLSGNITVGSAGTLVTTTDSQIGSNVLLTINGGTVNLGGRDQTVGSLSMTAGQVVQSGIFGLGIATGQVTVGKGSATINGGLRTNTSGFNFYIPGNGNLTVNGVIGTYTTNASAGITSTGLTLNGTGGTLSISGQSRLNSLDIKQGILQLTQGGNFGGFNTSTNVETAGSLNLNNQLLTIGNLFGDGAVGLGSGTLTLNGTGSTFNGSITGSGGLIKQGTGTFVLTGADMSTGPTTLLTGAMTVASTGSISGSVITTSAGTNLNINGTITGSPAINANGVVSFGANPGSGILIRTFGGLNIGPNQAPVSSGLVTVAAAASRANRTLLVPSSLSISGATNSWTSQLDLTNNDMVVRTGNLGLIQNQIKSGFNNGNWNGNGILSSTAAADTTHLLALGAIQNDNGSSAPLYGINTSSGLFEGYNPAVIDVLVKLTYLGDANLNGVVDGSDYSRIDNGYLNNLTGWGNGDFNYDGIVNGSDYTLMDNAYNTQGASLASLVATTTSQIAGTSSVPEPATAALLCLGGAVALSTRRRR